ncbi:MAG TPA: aldo/keto reductase [Tepidisphaeraceae bacterium]|nr:aldo/keto reductase [Tepidisphaeraceae bacterium]
MNDPKPSRRRFIQSSAVLTGAAILTPFALPVVKGQPVKRTATDQVVLNKTGIKLSRVGFGTGANNGVDQLAGGKDYFIKVIRHAYDQGVTYFDCAEQYQTFGTMGEAIKGLPREKLFIQSKIWPRAGQNITSVIDSHRKNFNSDYIDSLLIHCRTDANWTDQHKVMMDAYDQAKSKQWIRAKGVSCHSYPALKLASKSDWVDVNLVRINPQGKYMDGNASEWGDQYTNAVQPILDQVKLMHDAGHGVIGMKIIGNGLFKEPAEREASMRLAMSTSSIDAIVIGMKSIQEVDENLAMVNRVLAA